MDGATAEKGKGVILVTGASGFIGQGLIDRMIRDGYPIRAAVRAPTAMPVETVAIGEIGLDTDWGPALNGVDAIVHLAGRAHIIAREDDALAQFRKVNAAGTARLAEQAKQAGIRRFVMVSSVKAAADSSDARPLIESDPPIPGTAYGISKLEGEQALQALVNRMETVILRPPLVYGPGVRANFRALLRLTDSGLPLPLGAVHNRRSLIARDNLVDAIMVSLAAPGAAGGIFYVTDGAPLSTPDLIRRLAKALGKPARLWPFPAKILAKAALLIGRGEAAESLLGSLVLDDSAFRAATGWHPPVEQAAAFRDVALWYKSANNRS